jgi:hypothetical protein
MDRGWGTVAAKIGKRHLFMMALNSILKQAGLKN